MLSPVSGFYAASSQGVRQRPIGGRAKRSFDVVTAASLLVFLAPFFLLIAAIMRFRDPGPVFFAHSRIGYRGVAFPCLKFRTMVVDADKVLADLLQSDPAAAREWRQTQKLRRDPRVTRLGAFLRKTSLDELPQLLNVVRGEMSLVGPRPIVRDEMDRYGVHLSDYLEARPGVTGLWQISGRSNTGYDERVQLDREYVSRWSILRDLLILARTGRVVLTGAGSY